MFRIFALAALFLLPFNHLSAVNIVTNHKPTGRVLYQSGSPSDSIAAYLLHDFVSRMTGAKLPVVASISSPKKGDVVITSPHAQIAEDGFEITSRDGRLIIDGGTDRGSIYGVVTLLEKWGANYYGENEYTVPQYADLSIDNINIAEAPAFRYRQSQSYALKDPIYRYWLRLEYPNEEFAGNLWVHTFNSILPSEKYGKDHPEYYSFITGERRPGAASQWCLTNDEVFELSAQKIDSIFAANPGMNMISLSQNDGNNTYCTCDKCLEVINREGSPSGLFIEFLNRHAARRPDKQFSTLAYLFTMHPPKHVKPLPNVNIMLCDIDATREGALTDTPSGQDFMKAIEGWSKISDNIFVWDYGINFDGYLTPFPNFPILQKNIKIFRDHNAKMHFSQIGGSRGGDFAEMRAYVVSKLMWNPDLDVDSLMRSFMDGYYGPAAPYIYQYEKILEGGLLASGKALWIYDSPVTHKDGMLNKASRQRLNELLDMAEKSVADNTVFLDRVRRQRLTLQFCELEIARAEGRTNADEILPALQLFASRANLYNVRALNENNNSPQEYAELYKQRYIRDNSENKARGATLTWIIPPHNRYLEMASKALTDNIYGGAGFVENWVGWEGTDGAFILDMGEVKDISHIEADFLHQLGQWIFFPKSMRVSLSSDQADWQTFGNVDVEEIRERRTQFKTLTFDAPEPVKGRYIKVEIEGVKTCPGWHYGVGQPGWFFIDEFIAR